MEGPNFQKDTYVHPKTAWEKLRTAGRLRQDVYLYGATGYGKTELLHRYLRRRRHIWLSAEGLTVDKLRALELPEEAIVVIDDLTYAKDPALRQEIVHLVERPDVWLLLSGRCPLPAWLVKPYVGGRLSIIPEEDLWLSCEEIGQLYLAWGVQLPQKLLEQRICPLTEGNPLGARLLAMEMSRGTSYTEELMDQLTRKFYEYLNHAIYDGWPPEIREVLMQLAVLPHFTLPQAEELTGRSDVNQLLFRAAETGNLFTVRDEVYTLRPSVIQSMLLRMEKTYDRARKNDLCSRAGALCEQEGDLPRALELYQRGGCTEKIRALLVEHARHCPGGGFYYELAPAYLALPEEQVRTSPDLMAALSMLCSQALNSSESERWYHALQEYAAAHPEPEEHRLAESWLLYLDISLPHRGSAGLLELMEQAGKTMAEDHLLLPDISVTGGQPSLINGSKDFCDWTKDDEAMAKRLETVAPAVLGPGGKGLAHLALAESLFEKAGDPYRVMALTNRGLMETMDGGKFELQFVGAALLARSYLLTGHVEDSLQALEEIERRAIRKNERRVLQNVRAMICRVWLWQGRVDDAVRWLEAEPAEEIRFNVLERYCYNTRVRVCMALRRYDKAAPLLTRLHSYADMENRPWLQMESDLLESVIRYRVGDAGWQPELESLLRRAEGYHFIRLFSREGQALLPLLNELRSTGWEANTFYQEVLADTRTMAGTYPQYLDPNPTTAPGTVQLSEKALQVLKLQSMGLSRGEIAQQMGVSERTVKYQSEQAYRKLGVSNKMEAIEAARKLNLL